MIGVENFLRAGNSRWAIQNELSFSQGPDHHVQREHARLNLYSVNQLKSSHLGDFLLPWLKWLKWTPKGHY